MVEAYLKRGFFVPSTVTEMTGPKISSRDTLEEITR
jgi:hypothetical protein